MEKSDTRNDRDDNGLKDWDNGRRSAVVKEGKAATDPYSWGVNVSDQDSSLGDGGDLLGGFSWPPRSYTCTFCKREFRSAQALGGHMNVHRRDRARLRQMPISSSRDHLSLHPQNFSSSSYTLLSLNPDQNPNPNPNPNPNLTFSPPYFSSNLSSTTTMGMFPSFTSTSILPPLISPSPASSLQQPNVSSCLSPSTTHPSYRSRPIGGANSTTMMKSQIPSFVVHKYDGFRNENRNKIIKKSEIIRLNLEIGLLGESKSDDLDLELRLGVS